MIATGDVVALGTLLATLTFLAAGELFQFAMQLLDVPAHVIRVLDDLSGHRAAEIIGNDPVNVTVWGNYLE